MNKVLVKYGATWCAPCHAMNIVLETNDFEVDEIQFIDADQNLELCKQEGVRSLPTLILYVEGAEVKRRSGFMEKEELREWIGD